MDKPGIPWQHGGTWEGLLVLPVMLWIMWAGPEQDLPASAVDSSCGLLYSLLLLEAGLIF